jgi:hypothetical protein
MLAGAEFALTTLPLKPARCGDILAGHNLIDRDVARSEVRDSLRESADPGPGAPSVT